MTAGGRTTLDADTRFEFGWRDGAFRLDLGPERAPGDSLADTFAGEVIPEATPNPRTIRFVTGPIHEGPSRWYESAAGVDDPRAAQLFAEFDDVANVLVGPDFVAVGLRRPDRWEELLAPVLRAVTTEFTSNRAADHAPGSPMTGTAAARGPSGRPTVADASSDSVGRVERAWQELGRLRPGDPGDLRRIVDAVSADDAAVRQVAARLLVGADLDTSVRAWSPLLDDPSRGTRRACVDAMVDDGRPELRRLLERALLDADVWTRWKALRGIVDLGVEPSRVVVTPLAEDPDFRVRLEAAAALRSA